MDEQNAGTTRQEQAARALAVPAPVAGALTRFAEAARQLALWEAAAWTLLALVAVFACIAFADCFVLIGDGVRKNLALGGYAVCLLTAAPLLWRALRRRSAAQIARALEECVPGRQLEERVSTTVELASRAEAGEGVSRALIERVADEAAQMVESLDVEQLPDRRGVRRAAKAGLGALAAAVVLSAIPGLHMASFFGRALFPWGRFQRPSNTTVIVQPGHARVVEGALLEVEARLGGQVVDEVCLETREAGSGEWVRTFMDTDGAQPDRFTLKVGPMRVPLEYRVMAGDGLSLEYQVTVLRRPEVAGLKIALRYPAYSGLGEETFERINGDLAVLKNTRAGITVTSSTRLSAAVLEFGTGRSVSMDVQGASATAAFDVTEDTTYRIVLRSQDGIENPDPPLFTVRAVPDRPPQVAVVKPQADEVAGGDEMLQIEARAEDDLAIRSCRLVVRTDMRANAITAELQRPADAGKVWLIAQPWDLAGLFLQDGETVIYRVEAVDSAGGVGRSDERRLRVASGQKRESGAVLAELEKAQRYVAGAHRLMSSVRRDAADQRQVFRVQDVEFQSAERLLLDETLRRVSRETAAAAPLLEKVAPQAEAGPLRSVVTALSNALERFSTTDLRPLRNAAQRARSADGPAVAAGLDVLNTLTPGVEERLKTLHQALTAAHRYAGAVILAERATDVRDAQKKITPMLVGAAGWTASGTYTPGLLAEYYRGTNFEQLARRTVESRFELKNQDLPDVGRANFSVRWKGEMLAPRAGRYVFRAVSDDGVRLTVAGKRLIDEWRPQAGTPFEGTIELWEGWHELVLEYYQGTGEYEISLQRADPKTPMGRIPPEHLRNAGAPAVALGDTVRAAMAKGATDAAVQQARTRLQTMLEAAAGLAPELVRLTNLPPAKDAAVQKEAGEWGKEVSKHASELADGKALGPHLAVPLSQWRDHTETLAARYEDVRRRYRAALEEWLRKLGADVFEQTARLRELKENADAARKAYEALAQAAKTAKDEQREPALARADAAVRALAEDLKEEAKDIAEEFKKAADDMQRPLEERRLLQALEHRAEEMARGPAEALDQRLKEAATPEALARSQEKAPNFGTNAAELSRQAGELAQWAEKMERAVALREELKDVAKEAAEAREALAAPLTVEGAARQKDAAAELKDNADALRQAIEGARPAVDPNTLAKAQQVADQAQNSRAPKVLQQEAGKVLDAAPAQVKAPDQKARQEAAKELAEQAQKAAAAAEAVNKDLANAAQQVNGDAANALRETAKELQEAAQALTAAKEPNSAQPLGKAADKAEDAAERAANAAERLALDAEAARDAAKTDEQRARADDMVRLAAAVHNEAEKQMAPAAKALEQAEQQAQAAQAAGQQNPVSRADAADAAKQAQAEAGKLNKLAEVAAQLNSGDKNQQKAAHEALENALAEQGAAQNVAEALKRGEALDQLANAVEKAAEQNGDAQQNALNAAENALAEKLNADATQADRAAMAERLGEMAQQLRGEAQDQRQLAEHLEQAAGMEQRAREDVKREAPRWAQTLGAAQKEAADAAKAAKAAGAPEMAKGLDEAQKAIGQASQATAAEAAKAESVPLGQLAGELEQIAKGLETPLGQLAAAMAQGNEQQTSAARTAGRQARQAAGREAELAEQLRRAERAEELARGDAAAEAGDRATLEAAVHAALAALEKDGALPAAAQADAAALEKALNNQNGQSAGPPPSAAQARENGERLAEMAAQLDKVAGALQASGQPAGKQAQQGQSPAGSALRAMAQAEAAQETNAPGEAAAKMEQASELLSQAAEAARGQATGQQTPGSAEAQDMAQNQEGKGEGKGKGQGKSQSQGQGQAGAKGSKNAQSKGGVPPDPPKGMPIDKATWNRLPDSLRRDLLSAAGGRFPAEYEAAIKRYFKSVAADREERR
jgi:hypothetical protein